jgi:hypothetical protein
MWGIVRFVKDAIGIGEGSTPTVTVPVPTFK